MTAVVRLTGPVRSTRPLTRRDSAEVFGNEYGVLSECGGVLGETIKVVIFDPRPGEAAVPSPGLTESVDWVVEVDAGRYGLQATFKADVAALVAQHSRAKSESAS